MSNNLSRLKGSEKIRRQPHVMLGSGGIAGVQQTMFEIVSNSIDRFKKGFGEKVVVIRHIDNSITIEDFADGLPMDWNEEEKMYNWEMALYMLYAGGNYNKTDMDNGVLGSHGLGLASSQQSSEYMNVTVKKAGVIYKAKFAKGRPVNYVTGEFIGRDDDIPLSKEEGALLLNISQNNDSATGTRINYKPDLEVFSDICIPHEWIYNKLKKQAVVNPGLTILFIDELENKTEEFKYNDAREYLEELNCGKNVVDILRFNGVGTGQDKETKPKYKVEYDFIMTLNNEHAITEYYHNSSELVNINGNATGDAVKKALVDSINEYMVTKGMLNKNESKIKYADIEDSLLATMISKSSYTSYANQTKLQIDNKFIKDFITNDLKYKLNIYMIENDMEFNKICNRVLINKRSRENSEKMRRDVKKKLEENANSIAGRPEKFVPCRSKDPAEVEFILIEGDSAKNPIKMSRDARTMCIYPLKGKIINALKNNIADILKNNEVIDIFKILGCGITYKGKKVKGVPEFDISKLKVGKILITTDRDHDGLHIEALLLALFYVLAPELIKQGVVHILYTPLYIIESGKKTIYAYTEEERNEIIKSFNGTKFKEIRYKGLGGLSTTVLNSTAMNKEARVLKQVTWEDMQRGIDMLELCMSEERVCDRKHFIETEGYKFFDYSLLVD